MNKINIFIDFEAISNPFAAEAGVFKDLPYAFSMGIEHNGRFVVKTFIFNFEKLNYKGIYTLIRNRIQIYVNDFLGSESKEIKLEEIQFYGYNIVLEKNILSKVFKTQINIKDVAEGKSISLDRVTRKTIGDKEYFKNFRQDVIKKLGSFKEYDKSGVLAAIAGLNLFLHNQNKTDSKHYIDTDLIALREEIIQYSKDDVLRMKSVFDNIEQFKKDFELWSKYIHVKGRLKVRLINLAAFIHEYEILEHGFKVSDYIDELQLQLETELENPIEERDKKQIAQLQKMIDRAKKNLVHGTIAQVIEVYEKEQENCLNELAIAEQPVKHLL